MACWSDHLTGEAGRQALAIVQPVRRDRLYQGIVAQIEGLLERGELKPGDQLPAERQLAEQLQVSRSSVREALRSLELLGIVETRAGGGTFVRQAQPDDLTKPLTRVIARGHTLRDVIDVRGLIEPAIAERAAKNVTAAELAELHEILGAQEAKVARGESYVEEDTRFHEVIGGAARNELLVTVLGAIWDVLRASREEWLQTEKRARESLEAHRRILAALERRDPASARAAAVEHIRAVGEGILKLINTEVKPA
ncbi:MAG: FadR family transcriptional regulator [Chloroflexi bacterium]|nr:FadR family transcriptional regulator [Chloroflexota bacterium]